MPGLPAVRRGEDHRRRRAGTRTVTTGTAMALTLPRPAETSLTAVLVLATAVWIGGLAAIFVVARVAHATLGRSGAGGVLPRPGPRVRAGRRGGADGSAGQRGRPGLHVPLGRAADRQHGGRGGPGGRDCGRGGAGPADDPAAAGRAARARRPRADGEGAARARGTPTVLRAAIAALSLALLALGTVIAT